MCNFFFDNCEYNILAICQCVATGHTFGITYIFIFIFYFLILTASVPQTLCY
jgi:hypothetical protein